MRNGYARISFIVRERLARLCSSLRRISSGSGDNYGKRIEETFPRGEHSKKNLPSLLSFFVGFMRYNDRATSCYLLGNLAATARNGVHSVPM